MSSVHKTGLNRSAALSVIIDVFQELPVNFTPQNRNKMWEAACAALTACNEGVLSHCVSHALNPFFTPFSCSSPFHRLCSLTLKKLVVLRELDKELNSLSIAVKIQVGGSTV